MKKIPIFFFLLIVFGFACYAQHLTVAVSLFDARGGLTRDDADAITELFISELVKSGTVRVVDRNSFEQILTEMQFQASDWTDSNKVARLGSALNANSIIRGSVMSLAGQIAITTTILDINTAQIISSSTVQMANMGEVFSKLTPFVAELINNLPKPRATQEYKIGDRGPGGGFVFYDKGEYTNNWRYLEAAPLEAEFNAEWGPREHNVQGTSSVIGSGHQNTMLIVRAMEGRNLTMTAAQRCRALNFNGYRDWFLPSKDELNLMYQNLKRRNIGGFRDAWYWSSSQYSNDNAWGQRFSDGLQGGDYKNNPYAVRAIRAF